MKAVLGIVGMALFGAAIGSLESPAFAVAFAFLWGAGGYYIFVREEMP